MPANQAFVFLCHQRTRPLSSCATSKPGLCLPVPPANQAFVFLCHQRTRPLSSCATSESGLCLPVPPANQAFVFLCHQRTRPLSSCATSESGLCLPVPPANQAFVFLCHQRIRPLSSCATSESGLCLPVPPANQAFVFLCHQRIRPLSSCASSEPGLCLPVPAANQAFVFLATTDCYCMGALVVGQCLRRHRTTRSLAALGHVFDQVLVVDVLDSGDQAHLSWLGQPELGVTFTKLHCWTLTQYSKCVFLDADTLVVLNSTHRHTSFTEPGERRREAKGERRREAKGERRSQRGEEKPKVREATVSLIENLTESLLREVTLLTEEREKRPDYPQSQEKWLFPCRLLQRQRRMIWSSAGCGRRARLTTWAKMPSTTSRKNWTDS
ncbi:uncharacterized protein ACWYII_032822 [Salvelinus alpinus]